VDIEQIMNGGIVFGKKPLEQPAKRKPKKKLSGAQQMRADYHARIKARNEAQRKHRERKEK
jgi:hypothetical protein